MSTGYIKQVLIGADQFANTIAGGWADETWSSRCWREGRRGWVKFIDAIFGRGHCAQAYTSERLRLQSPPEER